MATTLQRWEPFRDFANLRTEMDRLIRQTFGGEPTPVGMWSPSIDVEETDENFVLYIEVPGVKAEDLDVSVEDDTLTIKGERKFYEEKEAEGFRRVERSFGSFYRAMRLPAHVLAEAVDAAYADGILTITVPKAEEAKPRKVEVTAA